MARKRFVNYPPEMVERMTRDYANGRTVDEIAEAIGKSRRSVISKLVREGVYVAPEKPVKVKQDDGPTKKELVASILEADADAPVDGLMPSSKAALRYVLSLLTR